MRQAAIMHEVVREVSTELGLRPPFTAEEYRRALSLAIGHPIEMTPRSISGRAFSGSCRAVQGAYIIQYRSDGSLIQQERIKYHQLGHITLGHVSMTGDDDRAVLSLCRALMTSEELDAEIFADALTRYALLGHRETLTEAQAGDRARIRASSVYSDYLDRIAGMRAAR